MSGGATVMWEGTNVDATTVERELSHLWSQLSKQTSYAHFVRTSIFNLVVYACNPQRADVIAEQLNELSRRSPSRAILLVNDRLAAQSSVDIKTSVSCRRGLGGQPVCYEQVIVIGHGRAADHLRSIVTPLLLAELPTYLWWPGQPPFGLRSFHRLLSVANQLVIDSADVISPGDGFADLARLASVRQGINDFNWERLSPWRDVIAQFFDAPNWCPYLFGILSMRLEFGSGGSCPAKATAETLLLLGWIATHLGWEPDTTLDTIATRDVEMSVLQGERRIPLSLQFRDYGSQAVDRLMRVEIVSQPKGEPPGRFTVCRKGDMNNAEVTIEIHGGARIERVVPLASMPDVDLLAQQLDLAGHDRQYEAVVDMASRLAGREVWIPA